MMFNNDDLSHQITYLQQESDLLPQNDILPEQPQPLLRPKLPPINDKGEVVFCICRSVDNGDFMIECDTCNEWFHGRCIGISKSQAKRISSWVCHLCIEFENGKPQQEQQQVQQQEQKEDEKQENAWMNDPIRKMARKGLSESLKAIFDQVKNHRLNKNPKDSWLDTLQPDKMIDLDSSLHFAAMVEEEMFNQLATPAGATMECGAKYKAKYRSLQFNLKDKKNTRLRKKIIQGDASPSNLVNYSTEELANENIQKTAELVRKQSIQSTVRPKGDESTLIAKTHKGEVEISLPKETIIYREPEQLFNVVSSTSSTPTTPYPAPTTNTSNVDPLEEILARMSAPKEESLELKRKTSQDYTDNITEKKSRHDEYLISSPKIGSPPPSSPKQQQYQGDDITQFDYKSLPDPCIIWHGKLHMPQVAKFNGIALQVGGSPVGDEKAWEDVLPAALNIDGRIPSDRVTQYLAQQKNSTTKEIVVIEFKVDDNAEKSEKDGYNTLFSYFHSRKRYAVIGHHYVSVKDMYVVPVGKKERLPDFLFGDVECSLPKEERENDILLGVILLLKDVIRKKD